jgi:hypothetical protein
VTHFLLTVGFALMIALFLVRLEIFRLKSVDPRLQRKWCDRGLWVVSVFTLAMLILLALR